MKTFCIIFFIFSGCNNQSVSSDKEGFDTVSKPSDKVVVAQEKDLLDHRQFIDFDSSYFSNDENLRSYFVKTFSEDLESINPKDIKTISLYRRTSLNDLGETSIYSITFADELPEVAPKSAYLVFSSERKQAALLFLNDIYLIKLRDTDQNYLIAGRYDVRGKGYAMIYQLRQNKQFDVVFNSHANGPCETGVPVYNASLDCISYDPFLLKFKNIDRDKDGLNDLVFNGTINSYCKGLEYNLGRNDRKPLSSQKVEIVFRAVEAKDSLSWQLTDTTICGKLTHSF